MATRGADRACCADAERWFSVNLGLHLCWGLPVCREFGVHGDEYRVAGGPTASVRGVKFTGAGRDRCCSARQKERGVAQR